MEFHTFPAFAFEGVECRDNNKKKIMIDPETATDQQKRCNPLDHVGLVFTAPVIAEEVKDHVTIEPMINGKVRANTRVNILDIV